MKEMELFKRTFPLQTTKIMGYDFNYRYHKHENSQITIVLLTGGIGLSDLFFQHFTEFSKDYSVITFDYASDYKDNKQLAKAIATLLEQLSVKAYLIGQSLGGIIAQIVAKYYPNVVEGLILSNTGSLSEEMDDSAKEELQAMIDRQSKALKMIKLMPFALVKKMMKRAVMKKLNHASDLEIRIMEGLCEEMVLMLTKEYELHMINLLINMQNYWNMKPIDFEKYKGKVLLILSKDDHTFNESIKKSLIELMPEPKVVTDITGGHLALMLKFERYAGTVRDFIEERQKTEDC